jgi:hypothetical protein
MVKMIEEDEMRPVKGTPGRNVVRHIAPIAGVLMLGLTAASCGSTTKTVTNNAPTSPAAATSVPGTATPAPTTTAPGAPKTGGAGF